MAKIMQTGAMKIYFQIAECSLSYAKIQIKSKKLTPLGGIFRVMEQFDSALPSVIDSTIGLRCR